MSCLARVIRDLRDAAAIGAGEADEFRAEVAKDWVWAAAGSAQLIAAARIARRPRVLSVAQRLQLLFKFPRATFRLEKARLKLACFRLRLVVRALQFGCFGAQQREVLSQDCRRAVFGYQEFERLEKIAKKTHFCGSEVEG